MAMYDVDAMARRHARERAAEHRPEPVPTPQRGDVDLVTKALAPTAFLVEATDRHRDLGPQTLHQLDDQPLGASGIQTENDLEDARCLPARWCHSMIDMA